MRTESGSAHQQPGSDLPEYAEIEKQKEANVQSNEPVGSTQEDHARFCEVFAPAPHDLREVGNGRSSR